MNKLAISAITLIRQITEISLFLLLISPVRAQSYTSLALQDSLCIGQYGPQTECMIYGLLTYDNSASSGLNNVIVNLLHNDSLIQTTLTDYSGQFVFSGLIPDTYLIHCESSIAWGGVNASDAMGVLRQFVGLDTLTGLRLAAADVTNDQVINAMDALQVAKRFVGLINSFPSGDWHFEEPFVNFDEGTLVFIEFKGICSGDVNGSYFPPVNK